MISGYLAPAIEWYSRAVRPYLRESAAHDSSAQAALFPNTVEAPQVYEAARHLLTSQCALLGVGGVVSSISSRGGRPFLLAGAVRDAVHGALTGISTVPRDYDIGVAGMSRDGFDVFCRSLGAERNRYGGYQCYASEGLNVDLWRIEETVGILAHACRPTVRNVLRTFILDLNAIAYDPTSGVIHDYGCLTALRRRRVGLVRSALLHDHSDFAGRAISLQLRFAFKLSPALRSFVAQWYDSKETERQLAKVPFCYSFGRPSTDLAASTPDLSGASSLFWEWRHSLSNSLSNRSYSALERG